jgi:hypothetical protein
MDEDILIRRGRKTRKVVSPIGSWNYYTDKPRNKGSVARKKNITSVHTPESVFGKTERSRVPGYQPLSGLARGYYREELKEFFPDVKRKIWTTCVSSVSSINKTLKKSGIPIPLNIRKSEYLFENRLDGYEAPFPCNQFWDIKQWKWLEENIDQIEGTILFWNIGGIYKF